MAGICKLTSLVHKKSKGKIGIEYNTAIQYDCKFNQRDRDFNQRDNCEGGGN